MGAIECGGAEKDFNREIAESAEGYAGCLREPVVLRVQVFSVVDGDQVV